MTQKASIPSWVKWPIIFAGGAAMLFIWIALASKIFVAVLFKGDAPFKAETFTIIEYLIAYYQQRKVVTIAVFSLAASGLVSIAFPLLVMVPKQRKLHGEARFASKAEISKMGLNSGDGLVMGKAHGEYLTSPGQHHVMLAAPTGAGKGVGAVIPVLLTWDHSAIVLDVKKENFRLTSKFRESCGHQVYLFDPGSSDRRTHRWNPLGYVREAHADRVDDIQKIGEKIYPDVDGTDPIWSGGCRGLFLGITLYLFETEGRLRTMGQVTREVYGLDDDKLLAQLDSRAKSGKPYSTECELSLRDYLKAPDKTRESIRKTFTSRLELFMNPNIDAATSANDFDLEALRKERISIYLGVTPDNLDRMRPLLSLFFQQVLDLHTRELPEHNPALKHQLLLLMDEFVAMGKMPTVLGSIGYVRGYNIRLMPIFQSPSQVEALYGRAGALGFFQNHTCRMMFEPADYETAEALSKELGTETVTKWSKSKPLFGGKGAGSQSESQQGRALLMAQELTTMGTKSMILLIRGQPPVKCQKLFYYDDHTFLDRLKSVAPSLAALDNTWYNQLLSKAGIGPIRRKPNKQQLDHAQFSGELSNEPAPVPLPQPMKLDRPSDKRPMRNVELADLDNIDSLPLSDFNVDFSQVEIPDGDLDEDQIEALADTVYRQMNKN
jgi:type IV secretion system protein VirD4